ncbi:hypothetical protein PLICRDRAFT_492952 [Plicaturopsis crispa FD-325 SS-3]|nr:hypothetical protein PLICRDRAFT_492952 [Plicaturopsis crispa FD-325 SS-3]
MAEAESSREPRNEGDHGNGFAGSGLDALDDLAFKVQPCTCTVRQSTLLFLQRIAGPGLASPPCKCFLVIAWKAHLENTDRIQRLGPGKHLGNTRLSTWPVHDETNYKEREHGLLAKRKQNYVSRYPCFTPTSIAKLYTGERLCSLLQSTDGAR